MLNINYMPAHIVEAENQSREILGDESKSVYIVTGDENLDELTDEYQRVEELLSVHMANGNVSQAMTLKDFVIPESVQKQRIERWNDFWAQRKDKAISQIDETARNVGFNGGAFAKFNDIVAKDYKVCTYSKEEIEELIQMVKLANE